MKMETNQHKEDNTQFVDGEETQFAEAEDGGKKIKKMIIVILLVAGGILLYQSFFNKGGSLLSVSGDRMRIDKGDNAFVGKIRGQYQEDLRVYGADDNADDGGWSPLAYADYFFTASVWTGNTADCERADAMNAAIINVIVEDEGVRSKIEELKITEGRRRATVTGRRVQVEEFLFEGEDHSNSLKSQGKLDPGEALIIDDIEIEG